MTTPPDRLMRHLAFFVEMLEEASEDTELGIDSGGGQTGGLRSSDKIRDVLGRRPRDIIRQHHLAAPRR